MNPFLNRGLYWISSLSFEEPPSKKILPSSNLSLPLSLCLFLLLSMNHETRNFHIVKYHRRMTFFLQVIRQSLHEAVHFILGSETKEGAYFNNLVNFKDYCSTLIHPWRRLMKSTTLGSLFFPRKESIKKSVLKTSQVPDLPLNGLSSIH